MDWLKKSLEVRDEFQPNLGGSLLRDLHETVDPLSMVLRIHLYLEAFIDAILTRRLKHPKVILKNRDFTFAMKLDMLRASNRVDTRLFHDIKRVNMLRNRLRTISVSA